MDSLVKFGFSFLFLSFFPFIFYSMVGTIVLSHYAFIYLELASAPTWSLASLVLYWKTHWAHASSAFP